MEPEGVWQYAMTNISFLISNVLCQSLHHRYVDDWYLVFWVREAEEWFLRKCSKMETLNILAQVL